MIEVYYESLHTLAHTLGTYLFLQEILSIPTGPPQSKPPPRLLIQPRNKNQSRLQCTPVGMRAIKWDEYEKLFGYASPS